MENKTTYHIIGAGIAGLYAAKLLKEKYKNSIHIVIYEMAEKIGGRCASTFHQKFACNIDNATHVVLNCNKRARSLLGKDKFSHPVKFWDFSINKFRSKYRCIKEAELAIFNTENASLWAKLYAFYKIITGGKIRAYFSEGNLDEVLCKPLVKYADDIKFGYVWKNIEIKSKKISKLIFNKQIIDIKPNDKIISAIDSYNYNKILKEYDFEYNSICNVFYRTSMALTLPQNLKMLGICKAEMQWLFVNKNYTAATISNANNKCNHRKIWEEICKVRNYNSAFEPQYQVLYYPQATINQNNKNNLRRPESAKTKFENLFICGDWTMKNKPCCIETAIESAIRCCKYI